MACPQTSVSFRALDNSEFLAWSILPLFVYVNCGPNLGIGQEGEANYSYTPVLPRQSLPIGYLRCAWREHNHLRSYRLRRCPTIPRLALPDWTMG